MTNNNFACKQVEILLSYYIGGNLTKQVNEFIEHHLQKCKSCREKYDNLRKMIDEINSDNKNANKKSEISVDINMEYYVNNVLERMSAYVDNELTDEESLMFKKYAIANPPIRQELEGMLKMKNALKSSFEKTKNEFKEDLSKEILWELDLEDAIYIRSSILKITAIFTFLFVFISISVIVFMQIF